MADEIGRLRIVCIADAAQAPAALAVRRRLDEVARFHLPAAIEQQVEPGLAVHLGRLTVRLDFDPLDYDDSTLAVLWASRIRAAILAATGGERAAGRAADGRRGGAPGGVEARGPWSTAKDVVAIARRVLAGDEAAVTELARVVRADPSASGAVLVAELTLVERRSLLGRLTAVATAREARGRVGRAAAGGARKPGRGLAGKNVSKAVHRTGRSWVAELRRASQRLTAAEAGPAMRDLRHSGTARMAGRARAAARHPAAGAALPSTVAGIALLWPWLGAHLEASVARLPTLEPGDVRRVALAALVADHLDAIDDPLVRILAGDDMTIEPSLIVLTAAELAIAAEGAAEVLDAFAAAIPGFAGSSAAFVRREFIVRSGEIEHVDGEIVVRLASLPLDPALASLPYPIAPFRLPWTAPISLRLGAS